MIKVMKILHITEQQFWEEMTPYSVNRLLFMDDLEADVQSAANSSSAGSKLDVQKGTPKFSNRARNLAQQT